MSASASTILSLLSFHHPQPHSPHNTRNSSWQKITYSNADGISESMRTSIEVKRVRKPKNFMKVNYSQIFGRDVNKLCNEGRVSEAMGMLNLMDQLGIRPDFDTYNTLLQSSIRVNALEEGRKIHQHMTKSGFRSEKFLGNQLLNLYGKLGSLEDACEVFDKMPKRSSVSWTSMIAAYAQNGYAEEGFRLYGKMLWEGRRADGFTFVTVLSALTGMEGVQEAKIVHGQVIKTGLGDNVFVATALLDLYFKFGRSEDACRVFDGMTERNVVSWSAMIAGYVKNGQNKDARLVFEKMPERDVVSWNAIIAGYAQNGMGDEAISLLCKMQLEGMKPTSRTFASVVRACASMAALERGKQIHSCIVKSGCESHVFVGSALVDMYAKCGITWAAWEVFEKMPQRNVVTWNAMIAGYAHNGLGKRALELFNEMKQMKVKPDNITFVSVLHGCSHLGLVSEGRHHFDSMRGDYDIMPNHDHYICMVDLLGRAGLLSDAVEFINRMPISPSVLVWLTLLGACRTHGNIEIGECAFRHIIEVDSQDSSAYVLLSNIYAAAGRWERVAKLRKLMKDTGVKKETGLSWIEIQNKVHTFVASDRSHPLTKEIYAKLEALLEKIKKEGYVPDTSFVLQDVEKNKKEYSLHHHSEKLAVAFGLISTPALSPIRIMKNLRMCGDCHSAVKYISRVVQHEISVRDVSRFHHFKDGICSCKDFW